MNLNVTYETLLSVVQTLMSAGRTSGDLTPEESTFWLVWTGVAEIDNGGLPQFFFNHSGDFAVETVDALVEVGALEFAEALNAAIACFPDGHVDTDTLKRRSELEAIDKDAFRPLEELFFSDTDTIDNLLITYVKLNMVSTILPDFIRDASSKAADQFREKNYSTVDDLLSPFESYLDGATLGKLKISRRKVIEQSNS